MSTEVYNIDENTKIIGNVMPDMENVSFTKEMIKFHAQSVFSVLVVEFEAKNGREASTVERQLLTELSLKTAANQFQATQTANPIPQNLETILLDGNLRKKDQERLLKGVQIKIEHLLSFFYRAEELGFQFSSFRFEGVPKDVSPADLPSFIHCSDTNEVTHIGGDNLSEGKMRQLVDQQKVLITRVASNKNHWHCLLQTFAGLKGKESGKEGSRPHVHYLSDQTTGLSYNDFVAMIKKGEYPHAKIHIPIIE